MGTCESTNEKKGKTNIRKNKGRQLFSAPIKSKNNDNNMTSNLASTMNIISILDNKNLKYGNKNRPSLLYKYRGTYCKKGEQISIVIFLILPFKNFALKLFIIFFRHNYIVIIILIKTFHIKSQITFL